MTARNVKERLQRIEQTFLSPEMLSNCRWNVRFWTVRCTHRSVRQQETINKNGTPDSADVCVCVYKCNQFGHFSVRFFKGYQEIGQVLHTTLPKERERVLVRFSKGSSKERERALVTFSWESWCKTLKTSCTQQALLLVCVCERNAEIVCVGVFSQWWKTHTTSKRFNRTEWKEHRKGLEEGSTIKGSVCVCVCVCRCMWECVYY